MLPAGQSYKIGEKIGNHVFEDDPGVARQPNPSQELSNKETRKTGYRCKKCRRIIAAEDNVISHTPGEGNSSFEWQEKRKGGRTYNKEQDCSSLYVEPLKWMTPGKPLVNSSLSVNYFNNDVVHSLSPICSLSAFVRDRAVEDGALEGKLSCIHCGARLGYFNWSGIQCNCGSWITPAFQISKSKVDVSTI
jgi:dual specificity phosphatase 12